MAPFSLAGHWAPNSDPQRSFVESTCREILYGGAAGGGKSAAATALPVPWMHLHGFLALILRRDSTHLQDLLEKAENLYPAVLGVKATAPKKFGGRTAYQVPGGGTVLYGHCQLEKSYKQFDGWEINLLEFEELTHFTEKQYKYICARVRSSDPRLPRLIRATTNPGGEGHEWVFRHWGAWLDPKFEAEGLPALDERDPDKPPAKPGEVWWIETVRDGKDSKDVYHRHDVTDVDASPKRISLSRTFIPAKLTDNRDLFENDPEYAAGLEQLDAVRRDQLLNGNWLAKPAAGLYFKRHWVQFVDATDVPKDATFCRGWDRAATEKTDGNNPNATCGVLTARKSGTLWICQRKRVQWSAGKVESLISDTAAEDARNWSQGTLIALPQDPGQAGKDQAQRMLDKLADYYVRIRPESGDKVTRFSPFSSQAEHGKVKIVRGEWNDDYIARLEGFDGGPNGDDDDADATSTSYAGQMSIRTSDGTFIPISSYRTDTSEPHDDFDDDDD